MKTEELLTIAATLADGLSVAGGSCDPCQPFGGSMGDDDDGERYAEHALSVAGDAGGMLAEIRKLGAQPCRMWGASPPGGCQDGCLPPGSIRKFCGKVLPYTNAFTAAGTYELKANEWFWPIYWVDSSTANTVITDLTYNQRPVFAGTAQILPNLSFPANGHNLVPGLPAINNVNGMVFSVDTADGNPAILRGHFVGIEVISG